MPSVHVRGTLPTTASPEQVWGVFSKVEGWRTWDWMGMADAAWLSGEPWSEGSVIRGGHRPFVYDCVIEECSPPHRVTWDGRGARVDARHTYRFDPHERGCLIVSEETFSGPLARTILPLVRWYWHRHLLGLRRHAETGGAVSAPQH